MVGGYTVSTFLFLGKFITISRRGQVGVLWSLSRLCAEPPSSLVFSQPHQTVGLLKASFFALARVALWREKAPGNVD